MAKHPRIKNEWYGLAFHKLPESTQARISSISDFAHAVENLVNEGNKPTHERRSAIEQYRRETIAAIREPSSIEDKIKRAFAETVRACNIPELEVHAFLDAAALSTYKKRYRDMHELTNHLRGSAVSLGVMIVQALGHAGERDEMRRHVTALAHALAITRVLLAVEQDARRGTIYLPQDILGKHGVTENMIERHNVTPELRKVIAELCRWARREYHLGTEGIHHLKKETRFAMLIATACALKELEKLEKSGYDVFSKHLKLGRVEQAHLAAKVSWRYKVRKKPFVNCVGL